MDSHLANTVQNDELTFLSVYNFSLILIMLLYCLFARQLFARYLGADPLIRTVDVNDKIERKISLKGTTLSRPNELMTIYYLSGESGWFTEIVSPLAQGKYTEICTSVTLNFNCFQIYECGWNGGHWNPSPVCWSELICHSFTFLVLNMKHIRGEIGP